MRKDPIQLISIVAILLIAALACESSEPTANNLPETVVPQQESTNAGYESDLGVPQTIEIQPTTAGEEAIQDPAANQLDESAVVGAAISAYPCVPQNTTRETAQLIRVVDGDTVEVLINGETWRVRYIGMDTPEVGDPFFAESAEANTNLIAGQELVLVKDVSETDQYGRLLRYVFVGENTFVNYELVKQGYAQIATYPPDVACEAFFRETQTVARGAGIGLWGLVPAEPTAPPSTDSSAGQVVIEYIFFDGDVPQVESDEYVEIKNIGGAGVDLSGWRLNADDPGQDFIFPSFFLEPGATCRVYTNEFHPESCGFSFGFDEAIWANKGECGHLFNANNQEVSTSCYNN